MAVHYKAYYFVLKWFQVVPKQGIKNKINDRIYMQHSMPTQKFLNIQSDKKEVIFGENANSK